MSRLTIDVTDQQHQTLKALAAMEGKSLKQYALERLFPESPAGDQQALDALKALLEERLAEARRGELTEGSIRELAEQALATDDRK